MRAVVSDGEGGIAALEPALNQRGVSLHPAGPGQHVPEIENKIKQTKERVRAHVNYLPFKVAVGVILTWLVYFCVSRINMVPSSASGDRTSPRERFLGRKLDYQRDLRVGFGDYVQTYSPNIIKNSMTSRTEGAIALLPVGNLAGSCKFFKLATKQVVTQDQWIPLPMPDNVIANMNKFADESKLIFLLML